MALTALIVSIVNDSFGYVAVQNERDPQSLVAEVVDRTRPSAPGDLDRTGKDVLVRILASGVSAAACALEAWQPMAERTRRRVGPGCGRGVRPTIVRSWSFSDSLFLQGDIETAVADMAGANWSGATGCRDFVTSPQSSNSGGSCAYAILGSLWVVIICMLFAARWVSVQRCIWRSIQPNWFSSLVDTNINNLAGVPSIIYGLLGLAFCASLGTANQRAVTVHDPTTANGRTALSAGLTLGVDPAADHHQRGGDPLPPSLREASYGLGATRWQTVWNVLPNAIGGILTGSILAVRVPSARRLRWLW